MIHLDVNKRYNQFYISLRWRKNAKSNATGETEISGLSSVEDASIKSRHFNCSKLQTAVIVQNEKNKSSFSKLVLSMFKFRLHCGRHIEILSLVMYIISITKWFVLNYFPFFSIGNTKGNDASGIQKSAFQADKENLVTKHKTLLKDRMYLDRLTEYLSAIKQSKMDEEYKVGKQWKYQICSFEIKHLKYFF